MARAMEMKVRFAGNKKVVAEYKGLTIQTDQPVPAGGDGSAPSPFDLFLASIATCAGFFTLSFCQARKLPTDGISITQRMDVDDRTHLVTRIDIEIQVPRSFPEKYYEPLLKAVDQCTVKKHLHQPPKIEVRTTAV
jgi:putative redox protein